MTLLAAAGQGRRRLIQATGDLFGQIPDEVEIPVLPVSPAVARVECAQPLAVEPGDQVGHGVAALAPGGASGLLVVGAVGDGQEHDGTGDPNGRCGA